MRTRGVAEAFGALLAAHLEDLRERRLSVATQTQALRVLPLLFSHLREEGVADPPSVAEEHLVRFARRLALHETKRGTPFAPATQANYLDAVKRFFAFLAKRRLLLTDPARDLALPKFQRLPRRVLSEAQARRLMAAPFSGSAFGLRDRAILETLYGTGIRRGECLRLDLMDLDLGQALLLVRNGKGKKDRVVPVPGRAALALDVYLREARPELVKDPRQFALFLSKYGSRVSAALLDIMVRTRARAAGIARSVSPHVLRHTCATHLLRGGADVRHVQELLGHRSLQTTQLYTRVGVEDLRAAIARAHPRERVRRRHRR